MELVKWNKSKAKQKLFIYLHILIPLVHFVLLFAWVKVDSVVLAFQKYQDGYYIFNGLNNFTRIFEELFTGDRLLLRLFGNSFVIFLCTLAWTPIPLFASYLVWKKIPFANTTKIIMFLPSIIPPMVSALSFRYIVLGFPEIFGTDAAATLITNPATTNITLFLYGKWITLGGSLVVYLGAMSGVDQSLVEYGKLDGLNIYGEFWHIVLPKIFPTMIALIVASFSAMLTADVGLYAFFRELMYESTISNVGYHMTVMTLRGQANYPFLSALGLFITVITIPAVFTVKWLMQKFGPSEN